jgi:uncharacterized membrane protein YphA (DoxX/SURF4 family)
MKLFKHYLPAIARILMGLVFFVTGLNGFLNFIPPPKSPMPEAAASFMTSLAGTGYMIPLVSGVQLLVGALLLVNRFVPLALTLIAPIIVGIITFHVFLEPSGLPLAGVVLILEIYLAWRYRKAFRPILIIRTTPDIK